MKEIVTKRFRLFIPVIILLLMISLVGCDFFFPKPKRVDFVGDHFSIEKPATWKMMKNLNKDAALEMGNNIKGAFTVVISETKAEAEEAGVYSVEEYSKATVGFVMKGLQFYGKATPEQIDTEHFPALKYKVSGLVDGYKTVYWHVTIETEGYYSQIILWSMEETYKENEAEFYNIVNSFDTNYEE